MTTLFGVTATSGIPVRRPRRKQRRRLRAKVVPITLATLIAGVSAIGAPTPAVAAWASNEHSTVTFTAGSVSPVGSMTCTAGLLQPVSFTWSPPTGGLTRTGYRWTVTGGLSGSGTLAANSTTITLDSGLVGLGTGTFALFAQGSGGWESPAATGSLALIRVVLVVNSTCSVP
jgi:hypothetical protein